MNRIDALRTLWAEIDRSLREAGSLSESDTKLDALASAIRVLTDFEDRIAALDTLFSDAGLFAAGFAFFEPTARRLTFFEQGPGIEPIASRLISPYVVKPGAGSSLIQAFVHKTFVQTRRIQAEWLELTGRGSPEFMRVGSGSGIPRAFRKFGVTYIGSHEVALGIAAWVHLRSLQESNGANAGYITNNVLSITAELPFSWLDRQFDSEKADKAVRDELRASWIRHSSNSLAFCDFVRSLGYPLAATNDVQAIAKLSGDIDRYIARLLPEANSKSVSDVLRKFEENARFPILPYFIWGLLLPTERAHLVAPIWRSFGAQLSDIPVASTKNVTVGWALASVTPFHEWQDEYLFLDESELTKGREKRVREHDGNLELDIVLSLSALHSLARPSVDVVYRSLERRQQRKIQSLQAIAKIMARNVSHNLGSHVVNNVLGDPGALASSLRRLLRYLQERMDFIALVAGNAPYWETASSLRDAIEQFAAAELGLLETIVRHQWASRPAVTFEGKDRSIAVPHGQTGRHAIYAILENLIRNAAQHAQARAGKLEFRIRYTGNTKKIRHRQFCEVAISDNKGADNTRVKLLNEILGSDIFDADDPIGSSVHWGLKEIRIATAFLVHGLSGLWAAEEIAKDLAPRYSVGRHHKGSLTFNFWVEKPSGALIVSTNVNAATRYGQLIGEDIEISTPNAQTVDIVNQFDLVIFDSNELAQRGSLNTFRETAALARRIGVIGKSMPGWLQALGAQKLLASWDELGELIRFADSRGVSNTSALCERWVRCRWPDILILLISNDGSGSLFPELAAFADVHAKTEEWLRTSIVRSSTSVNEGTRLEKLPVTSLAVFDHSEYAEQSRTRFDELNKSLYHMPIKAPFKGGESWRVIESAALRICVVDERIANRGGEIASGLFRSKIKLDLNNRAAWGRLGVDIVAPNSIETLASRIKSFGEVFAKVTGSKKYDFIVVHRSLLRNWAICFSRGATRRPVGDRASETEEGPTQQIVEDLLNECLRLVFVSGSGPMTFQPHPDLNSRIRQLDFSALNEAMEGEPDKSRLTRLLTSL